MSASSPQPAASSATPPVKAETVVIRTISGPVTSTSIIMSTQAYSSNERIFLNYEVLFKNGARNDTEESFAATAHKFSEWLKVDRAYYSQARPWIVRLLQIARQTIQRIAGIPEQQPFHVTMCAADLAYWVDAYVLMLRTVQPFDHHFVEDDLRGQLAALFLTIAPPLPRSRHRPVPTPLQIASSSHTEHRPRSSSGIVSSPSPFGGRNSAASQSTFVQSPFNTDMSVPPHSAPPHPASSSQQPPPSRTTSSWTGPNLVHTWKLAADVVQNLNAPPVIPPPGLPRRSSSSGSNFLPHSPTVPFATAGTSPLATPMPFSHSLVSSPPGFAASFPSPGTKSPTRATTFQIPTSPRASGSVSAPRPFPALHDSSVPLASTSASAPVSAPPPPPAPASAPVPATAPASAPAKLKRAKSKRKNDYDFLKSDLDWYIEQKQAEQKQAEQKKAADAQGRNGAPAVAESASEPGAVAVALAAQIQSAVDAGTQPRGIAGSLHDSAGGLEVVMGDLSSATIGLGPLAGGPQGSHDEPNKDVEMTEAETAPMGHKDDAPIIEDAPNDSQPGTEGTLPPVIPSDDTPMPAAQDSNTVTQGKLVVAPSDAPMGATEPAADDNARMEIDTIPIVDQDVAQSAPDNAIENTIQGQILDLLTPAEQMTPIDQSQHAEVVTLPTDNTPQPSHDLEPLPESQGQPSIQPVAQVPAPLVARIVDLSKVQSPFGKPRSSKKGANDLIVRRASSLQNPFGLPSRTTPPAPTTSTSAPSVPVTSTSTLIPPIETIASESGGDNEDADDETGEDDDMVRRHKPWTHKKKHVGAAASASTTATKAKKGPPGVKPSDLQLPSDAGPPTTPSAPEAESEHSRPTVKGHKGRKGPPGIRSAPIGGGIPVTPTKRSTSGRSADAQSPRSPLIIRIPSKQERSEMLVSSDSEDEEPLAVAVRRASEQRRKASAVAALLSSTQAPAPAATESLSGVPPSTATGAEASSSTPDVFAMDVDQSDPTTAPQEHAEAVPAVARPKAFVRPMPDIKELLSRIKATHDEKGGPEPPSLADGVPWERITPLYPGMINAARPDEDEYAPLPLFNDSMVLLDHQRGAKNVEPCKLTFELTEQQLTACGLWASRYKHTQDMAESLCVSIFCYSLQECAKSVGPNVTMTDVFRRHKPIPWPKKIRHRVKINDKPDGDFVLINFHTPRDNLIDISRDVRPGKNNVTITPIGRDAYDFVYVVLLHFPTPRQMGELEWRRDEDRKWTETLKKLRHFPSPLLAHLPGGTIEDVSKGTAVS